MIPSFTPTNTTIAAVSAATTNSTGRRRSTSRMPRMSMSSQRDDEDDGRQDRARHVGERLCEEQQDDRHARGGRELRHLALAARAVDHRRLRRAAVHDERAGDAGRQARRAEAHEVDVLVEAVAELRGVGPGGRGALREDDDEDRHRGAEQLGDVAQRHVGPAEARQPARHGAERGDAVGRQVEALAGADRADDGEQRPRDHARDPGAEDEEGEHAGGHQRPSARSPRRSRRGLPRAASAGRPSRRSRPASPRPARTRPGCPRRSGSR